MSEDEGTTTYGKGSQTGIEQPSTDPTPSATDETLVFTKRPKFLFVGVCPGASRPEIVKAVEKALEAGDVPFFAGPRGAAAERLRAKSPSDTASVAQLKEQSGGVGQEDALLILVEQEGW